MQLRWPALVCLLAARATASVAKVVSPLPPGICAKGRTGPKTLRQHIWTVCPIPIDEESEPARWPPWTHVPHCVNTTSRPTVKYCVYSNANFGSYGLSVITRPEVAASSIEVLDDPSEFMLPFRPSGGIGSAAPPYIVTDVPGKGKGVIATRLIRPLEMFMADHASLLVDVEFPGSVKQAQGYRLLHHAADQLSDPELGAFNLGRSSTSGADIVEDVLRTNSFHSDLFGVGHMALFPEVSVELTGSMI